MAAPNAPARVKMVEVDAKPNKVKAAMFPSPKIVMQGKDGIKSMTLNNFKPKDWGMNTGGILPEMVNGRPVQINKMQDMAILCDNSCERAGKNVLNTLSQYIQKRGFRTGNPWPRPDLVNVQSWQGANQNYGPLLRNRRTGKSYSYAIVIIPEGTHGSEIKTRLTKQAQMSRTMTNTQLQFIRQSCAGNSVKVMGALENMLTKAGYQLYRIDPEIPRDHQAALMLDRPGRSWVMGLDVSHNGTSKPSICCLAIARDAFSGGLGTVDHGIWANPPRKEVIGYKQMIGFFYENLNHIWNNRIKQDPKKLPECLWIFRDGLAEGQLHEAMSKEYNGICRACREFAKNKQIKVSTKGKNGKPKMGFWKPKIQFVVVQKRILDRIGVPDGRGNLNNPRDAVVVFDTCLEKKLWDFVAWFNTKGKNRPLRYIVVKDDLGVAKDHAHACSMFKMIYAMTYLYPFSLPFTMGNVNQPGVVKLAKHYSELWSQMIFTRDTDFDSLETNPRLNRPHLFFKRDKDLKI